MQNNDQKVKRKLNYVFLNDPHSSDRLQKM